MTSRRERAAQPSLLELVAYLADGVSVQLLGLPGSGRSVLARKVADELSDIDYETIWVKAIAPLRDRPLASLALAGVAIEPVPASVSTTMVVAKATDALGRMAGKKRAALVIDDAEHLDPASGGVILAARARNPFPILFTDRPGRDADELVSALVTESQPGVRLTMAPLPLDDIHELVHEVLQGVVEPAVVARVAMLSGGLPRLITALVDAGRRSGRLTRAREVWSLTGELWDERLVHVIHPLLRGLAAEDLAALTSVAHAAGSPAAVQAAVTAHPAAVARLREAGLLRTASRLSGCAVTVFPPLLADHLRRHGPADPGPPDLARAEPQPAGWLTRLPQGVDASEWASRLDSHLRGEVAVLRRTWEEHPDDTHAAQLLAAMQAGVASPADVAAVLELASSSGTDVAASAAVAGWSAAHRALAGRDLDGALAELDRWRVLLPVADGYLTACKAHLCFLGGRALEVDPLLADARPRLPICREAITAVRAENLIAAAKTSQALDLLVGDEAGDPLFAGHHRVCSGLARVLGGDASGGVEWTLEQLGDAVESFDPSLIDGHAYAAALGLTLLGALDDLDDLIDVVFRFPGSTTLQRHFRAGLCSLAATAKAWQGRTAQAARLSAQAAALGTGPGPFPAMLVALDPDRRAEARQLWELVEVNLSNGYLAAAVFDAVTAAELAVDEHRAAAVVAAGSAAESAVVGALAGYVAALAAGDLDALATSAGELRSACGPVYAMRALISRAELLRNGGDSCAAAAQADAAWHESGDLGKRCPGLFSRLNAAIRLSAREREIVALAARGFTSVQIADEVEVTRRTAETHTSSAYHKIGVHNRKDLCDALSTWLVV